MSGQSYYRPTMDPSSLPGAWWGIWEWMEQAACRDVDPDIFFTPDGEYGPRRRQERQAKAVCASCPVLRRCRAHACEVGEPYGIWGGLTEREREQQALAG